jgi:diacylglycerol kinase (ATP)
MKILFIINPLSGGRNNEIVVNYIHRVMKEKKVDYKLIYTSGKNDDIFIKITIENYLPDRIVSGGGDGTLQLVARNIMHSSIPLCILALGSANGLATALELPINYEEGVMAALENTKIIPLDLIRINEVYICIHLCDIGINAMMVRNYSETHQRGMRGYIKYLRQSIRSSHLLRYEIITPEKRFKMKGVMLIIANANQYGTRIRISKGSVSDGKFEICNVPKYSLYGLVKAFLTKSAMFRNEKMFSDVISCKEATVIIDQNVDFQIDGEHIGVANYLKAEILPGAINLLVA